jgi:hypothetical protein
MLNRYRYISTVIGTKKGIFPTFCVIRRQYNKYSTGYRYIALRCLIKGIVKDIFLVVSRHNSLQQNFFPSQNEK